MCGRFAISKLPDELIDEFEITAQDFGLQLVGIDEQLENIFFSVQKSLSTNQ